jgi:septal ring factor EnvC (AmiA/AmiB activator)
MSLIKEICETCKNRRISNASFPCCDCCSRDRWEVAEDITLPVKEIKKLEDTIEDQQQEIFELKHGKYCRDYYVGKVMYFEAENKKRKDEIDQLRAQVARMERLGNATIVQLETQNKALLEQLANIYGLQTNVTIAIPTDYHNPADIEALKLAREALTVIADCYNEDSNMATWNLVKQALAAIEQIGGKEDV